MRVQALVVTAICGVMLTACGGGGGGGDKSGSNQQDQQLASTITRSNAMDVAAQSYSSSQALNDRTSDTSMLATGVEIDSQNIDRSLLNASLDLLYKGLEARPSGEFVTGITVTDTAYCPGGGSITETLDFSTYDRVSNGDKMTISANACMMDGVLLNGTVSYVFSNLTGTIGSNYAWSGTLALTYSNLTMAYNGDAVRIKGDLTMAYSQNGYGMANASIYGNSLSMTVLENNSVTVDRRLSNYDYDGSINGSNATFSTNYTLSGNFPRLGNGTYTVATVTPFQLSVYDSAPTAGVLTVTATDNSSLRLTAVDSMNVRLDIDQNGDKVTDEVINTTWADLNNRI